MIRPFSFLWIGMFLVLCVASCDKDHDSEPFPEPVEPDAGEFIAIMNGNVWKPDEFTAVYYLKWQQLYIQASDSLHRLETGIMLDSTNFLKNYLLESNGENASILISDSTQYHSDLNWSDAGGNFLLTKFDTANRKVSGQLKFRANASGPHDVINFASTSIKDIKLILDGLDYPGNLSKSTVIGVKTTEWLSKDILAEVSCRSGSLERLKIQICSPVLNPRRLVFNVPISKPGVYPVVPDNSANNLGCTNENVRSVYSLHFSGYDFYPLEGTFTIISIDPVLKKMKATFDIIFKDPVRQQLIQIKNGTLKIETW